MYLPRFRAAAALAITFAIASGLTAGCAAQSSIKPAEVIDERTGMTVGALHEPIEFVEGAENVSTSRKRISFAYLGPVEWDNMGDIRNGLWVHLAPGTDWRFEDIRMPGAVTLILDGGSTALSVIDPPPLAHAPYRPVVSWGQTAYFDLSVQTLKRMASSQIIELDFKADSVPPVRFTASRAARETLLRYLHARGY
jgi:hypothetical protein